MNAPVEVFLDQTEMQIFDEVKRTALTYLECKHTQLDVVMPAHRYLSDRAIETIVPTASISRAVEHCIFEMTPEQRTLLPMERIAGESWRKLKRGGQRIYILEKEGNYFIHLKKRKDWAAPTTQEARY